MITNLLQQSSQSKPTQILKAGFSWWFPGTPSSCYRSGSRETLGSALESPACAEGSSDCISVSRPPMGFGSSGVSAVTEHRCTSVGSYRHHPYLGVGTEQKSWAWLRAAASCSWPITATVCPFSPNGSVVLTRQLSVISSEGGECPNKMSTKRRVAEKKPAEPPLPRRNPNEKLIQAETTEVGTVSCGSPLPFSSFFFFLEKKKSFFFHLLCFC